MPPTCAGLLTCTLDNARVVEIALVFGFSIATLVYCSASFSGALFERQRRCQLSGGTMRRSLLSAKNCLSSLRSSM
jgi:hypothetical protein